MNYQNLSKDIWSMVIAKLYIADIMNLSQTCKYFHNAVDYFFCNQCHKYHNISNTKLRLSWKTNWFIQQKQINDMLKTVREIQQILTRIKTVFDR